MLSIFDNCRASVGLCNALMNLMIGKHAPQNVSQAGGKGGPTDDADIVTMVNPGALQLILHVLKNSAFDSPRLTSNVLRKVERMLSPDMQGVERAADVAVKNLELLLACQQDGHPLMWF